MSSAPHPLQDNCDVKSAQQEMMRDRQERPSQRLFAWQWKVLAVSQVSAMLCVYENVSLDLIVELKYSEIRHLLPS